MGAIPLALNALAQRESTVTSPHERDGMKVYMREGDAITIELPGGSSVSLMVVSPEDADCLPELDIMLPVKSVANCWNKGLTPGTPLSEQAWSVECSQISIPIVDRSIWTGTIDENDHEWAHVCKSCADTHKLTTSDSCIDGNHCLIEGCDNKTSLVHYLRDDR